MELRVLGPVELRISQHCVDLGQGRKLALVVALGLEGGKPLSREIVLERIFDGNTPNVDTFNSYISRLRDRLESAGVERSVLAQRAGAYSLALAPGDVDWLRFRQLHSEALRMERTGEEEAALARLEEARGLWRGEPLTGLSGTWVQGMRETMRRLHRSVLADWGSIALRLRFPGELIGRLAEDAEQYPLSGPLTQNLMVALHEAGRTEEALTAYHSLRDRLAEAQGTDPDPQLRETYQRLLVSRIEERDQPPPGARRSAAPHRDNLQRDLPDFSGRHTELTTLLRAVRARSTSAMDVHIISGMPGVGKSVFATRAGHLLREDFPDARLHLDLHGNREQSPKEPMEALQELLVMLGVPAEAIHPTLELRAAQWRDATAELRALLVLDDARDQEQVRWLLPGGPGCTVLVTSRNRMPDLEGARNHRLGHPPPGEAVRLFATLAAQDPDSGNDHLADLVRRAEYLPLALRLLANRWRRHPAWGVADLIGQLDQARARLAEFHAGSTSLHAAFRVSLHALSPAARAAFVRLGLHPVPEFGAHAAAAVTGESLEHTHAALDELANASLVEEPWPQRYSMHALLAEFARECADEELSPLERHGVTHRTMDYYLASCTAADHAYLPNRHRLIFQHSYPVELPGIGARDAAVHWFRTELPTLLEVLRHAAIEGGFEHYETGMAHALAELLDMHTPGGTAVEVHQRAVDIAAGAGDHERLGQALLDLGKAQLRAGAPGDALDSAGKALHHWRDAGDRVGRARTLDLIGLTHMVTGQPTRARGNLQEALDLAREMDHRPTVASALEHLGVCKIHLGERQAAARHLKDAQEMHDELGNIRAQAITLTNLSRVCEELGQNQEASAFAEEAAGLLREVGDMRSLARLTGNTAELRASMGDHAQALRLHLETLETFRALHDRPGVVQALCNAGRAHLNLDDPLSALSCLRDGWEHAVQTSEYVNRAELLVTMGDAHRHLNDTGRATEYYHHALETARRDGETEQEAWALAGLAHLASQAGTPQRARSLFLEGQSVLERANNPDVVIMGVLADVVVDDELRPLMSH